MDNDKLREMMMEQAHSFLRDFLSTRDEEILNEIQNPNYYVLPNPGMEQ